MPGRYLVIIVACANTALAGPRKPPKRAEPRDVLEAHVVYTAKQSGSCDNDGTQRIELRAVGRANLQIASMGGGGEGDQLMFMSDTARVAFSYHDGIGPTTQDGTGEVASPPGIASVQLSLVNHNGVFIPLGDEGNAGVVSVNGPNVQTTWWAPGCGKVLRRASVEQGMFTNLMYDGQEDPKGWKSHKPKLLFDAGAIGKAIASGKPAVITATAHYHWGSVDKVEDADVTVTLRIRPPKIEAHFVADDKLDTWIPEGPTPKKKTGNTFAAHLELVDPDTGKPPDNVKVKKATYTLESSSVPGACGNWPVPDDKDPDYDKPDLFLEPARNPKGKVLDANQQKLELGVSDWAKPVVVSSRDWGAYGQLTAVVELDNGTPIAATFKGDPGIPLPLDANHDHVADAWAPGQGRQGDVDDESSPPLGSQGDGYSVYEEYRGFLLAKTPHRIPTDEELTRLDPQKRDLLVVIDTPVAADERDLLRGTAAFSAASGITVRYIGKKRRLVPHENDSGLPRGSIPNSNRKNSMVAVWVTENPPVPGKNNHAVATAVPANACPGDYPGVKQCYHDPSKVAFIRVFPKRAFEEGGTFDMPFAMMSSLTDTSKWGDPVKAEKVRYTAKWRSLGADAPKLDHLVKAATGDPTIAADLVAFSVMHEMGHAVGMFHHGELDPKQRDIPGFETGGSLDCPMRYWQFRSDENAIDWYHLVQRTWSPATEAPDGHPWKFCDENTGQANLHP